MQTSQSHQLVADHLKFSEAIALNCVAQLGLDTFFAVGDVLSWAQRGLVEAANRYSPDSGATFTTYSYKRIRGAVVDGARRERRSRRLHARWKKASEALRAGDELADIPVDGPFDHPDVDVDTLPQTTHASQDAAADANRLRETILDAIHSLPDLERTSILLYYYEGLDLSRIAKRFGISKCYSSRIHSRALRLLQTALAGVPEAFGVEVGE
jgi:RNA polymerase sigma factor for flagellar operon FliA